MNNKIKYYFISSIIIFLIIIVSIILFLNNSYQASINKSNTANLSSNAANVIIGVAASSNITAMNFAIHSGVHYFREDIALNKSQEQIIKNFTKDDARFIGIIDYETLNISTSCNPIISNCNWTLDDWNSIVYNTIRAYPEIHIWEIWNEPQLAVFQSGFQNGSPYNYYLMAKSAYNIIKAYNSSDSVLCFGGDNVYDGQSIASINDPDFRWASSAWQYGLSKYCDAISLHVYTNDKYLLNQSIPYSNSSLGFIINNQINLYENLTGKPIFITETGIPSNNGTGIPSYILNDSLKKQAIFLNQSFSLYLSKPFIKGIIWFNLIGYEHKPYNLDFGILNSTSNINLLRKPSWYIFMKYINESNYR
ncbi:MAG: cellulase family glycosylhydrolase [Candidatus Marsarchaeota archaeon]|nr:cellulase family glycosylhydrolase [Candidatus Marsarchaeota archaeon]